MEHIQTHKLQEFYSGQHRQTHIILAILVLPRASSGRQLLDDSHCRNMMMLTDLALPDLCNGDKRLAAGQNGITFQENNQVNTSHYNFSCTIQKMEMNTTHLRAVFMFHMLLLSHMTSQSTA